MAAVRFGTFTLELSEPALLRGGRKIALRPQSLKVLAYLAERPGRTVTNKELIESLWDDPKQASNNSLAQCINDIREALGDADHRLVRNVPRRGYLLAVPLSESEQLQHAPATEAALGSRTAMLLEQAPRAMWTALTLSAVLVLLGTWFLAHWAMRPAELTMMAVPSIVVLPIAPLGDDTDAVLAQLADEVAAGVWRAARGFDLDIRPTSAVKDRHADPNTIGRELGVRYVVRGLARRDGQDLSIDVELIEADRMRQLWLGAFELGLGQPKAQSRTAALIGRTLAAELLRIEVRRPLPARPAAAHFTMLGRALMTERISAERNARAIAYFEKALVIDPNHFLSLVHYARATAGYSLTGWMPENEHEDRLAKAESAIQRALQQEPKSVHAHAAHGQVLRAKGEHEQAIEAFRLALLHNPDFVHARAELGRSLIDIGKPEQAIAAIEKAIEISPTDISLYTWYYWAALAALHVSDHERALAWLQRSFQINPSHDNTLRLMAVALAYAGREDDARKKIAEFLKVRPGATLDDWRRPSWDSHPEVTARRQRMRATLKRLGVPEVRQQAAFTR